MALREIDCYELLYGDLVHYVPHYQTHTKGSVLITKDFLKFWGIINA